MDELKEIILNFSGKLHEWEASKGCEVPDDVDQAWSLLTDFMERK